MVSAELEERMLPSEPEAAREEEDWEDSWLGPLILLGLLVAGLIAAIVVLVTYKGHAPSPPQPSAQWGDSCTCTQKQWDRTTCNDGFERKCECNDVKSWVTCEAGEKVGKECIKYGQLGHS